METGDPPKNVVIDYMDRYKDKDRGLNTAAANIAVTENSPMLSLLTGGIVSSQSNGKGSVVQKGMDCFSMYCKFGNFCDVRFATLTIRD